MAYYRLAGDQISSAKETDSQESGRLLFYILFGHRNNVRCFLVSDLIGVRDSLHCGLVKHKCATSQTEVLCSGKTGRM